MGTAECCSISSRERVVPTSAERLKSCLFLKALPSPIEPILAPCITIIVVSVEFSWMMPVKKYWWFSGMMSVKKHWRFSGMITGGGFKGISAPALGGIFALALCAPADLNHPSIIQKTPSVPHSKNISSSSPALLTCFVPAPSLQTPWTPTVSHVCKKALNVGFEYKCPRFISTIKSSHTH